jgi:hypothetical protein
LQIYIQEINCIPIKGRYGVPSFKCYGLNEHGRIAASEDLDAPDLATVLQSGWKFVAQCPPPQKVVGLEVWQGHRLLFSTHPPQDRLA